MKNVTVFFYGTLKRGHYNHKKFLDYYGRAKGFHLEFLREARINGATLVQRKGFPYPYCIETGMNSDFVRGEVFSVDIQTFWSMQIMEDSAGYKLSLMETADGTLCFIFFWPDKHVVGHRFHNFPLPKPKKD